MKIKWRTAGSFFIFIILLITFSQGEVYGDSKQEMHMKIDLWSQQLYLLKGEEVIKQYKVAPGTEEMPTPIGEFIVKEKSVGWGGGFGTRWMGLNVPWGMYGIHGTNKPWLIGKNVSSGCIRMRNEDVEELYELVKVGMEVQVEGPITGIGKGEYKNLSLGSKGNLVQLSQERLKYMNYYHGPVNGIFNKEMENAVKSLQVAYDLPSTGGHYRAGVYLIGDS